MNTWLKNLLITFIIIIAPSVVIDVIFYEISALGESTIIVAIGTYAITITGLVLFYRYRPCSASPRLPKAQANPQKNLPNRMVNRHRAASTATKGVQAISSPAPIWVRRYFIPAKAVVKADGKKIKQASWIRALIHA